MAAGHDVSVPLDEYRRKRDAATHARARPGHDPAPGTGRTRFVIQEHHARALHWDVRLERDGVLASWAVPKGLPTEPDDPAGGAHRGPPDGVPRLHGEIPAGEYGGGSMTIWDPGNYET